MIQRIQTVYLLLAAVLAGLTFAFPFATYYMDNGEVVFNAYGVSENLAEIDTFFPYYITVSLSMGLSIFSILQYKKRKLQLKVGRFNYFLLIITIAFIFIDFSSLISQFAIEESSVKYGIGMFMPVAALPLVFLATRAIKKDEDLIKSLDRLR